jgi:antitoxin component YwqK of YwqJK toxin-antitoxin module
MRFVWIVGLIGATVLATGCAKKPACINGEEIVDCKYVHKYGVTVPQQDWTSRGENGKVVSTLKNGVVVAKNYVDGELHGETTYTFPYGDTVEKMESYEHGQLKSDLTYYSSGIPMREVQYPSATTENVTVWYESGSPRFREKYVDTLLIEAEYFTPSNQVESVVDNGNGTRISRDPYGILTATDTIDHGRLVLRTTAYPNGAPKEVIPYVNDQIQGVRKTFYPGGEPHTVEDWSNGNLHGVMTTYQNGEKVSEIVYVEGKKNGLERHYRNGKEIVEEISWQEDLKHGPCALYLGDNSKTEWYYQGKPVSKISYDLLANPKIR